MNVLMSFILYNPLEAMILLIPIWYINKDKINYDSKIRICAILFRDAYIVGTLLLLLQIPMNLFEESLIYTLYNVILLPVFMVLLLRQYSILFFKYNNWIFYFILVLGYYISFYNITSIKYFDLILSLPQNKLIIELYANLYIKIIQTIILFLILGGISMFKKLLKIKAKKHIQREVAATICSFGEPNLSEKLKKEVKSSK